MPFVFLRKAVVLMIEWAKERPEYLPYAALFLLAYTFLLRVPSEALPALVGGSADSPSQSALTLDGDVLQLKLQRRKNKPHGSTLKRHCWCETCPRSCPIHVLAHILDGRSQGEELFGGMSAQDASKALKHMLGCVGVKCAGEYRLHDLRRGHARDLQLAGGRLSPNLCK